MKEKFVLKNSAKILISLAIITSSISIIENLFFTQPVMAERACGASFHVKAYETKDSFIYICPTSRSYLYIQIDKKTGRSMRLVSEQTQDGFRAIKGYNIYQINDKILVVKEKNKLKELYEIIKVYQAGEKVNN